MAPIAGLSAFGLLAFANQPAQAVTLGSNLASAPNGSICTFASLEPEERTCTVGQRESAPGHSAPGGLLAPFDGVVVRWSVVSGPPPPGTGPVKLQLRAVEGPGYRERGMEVALPPSPPGTAVRHSFAERMPISAGQPIGLTIRIANRSTQEAGVPIAFRETGAGAVGIWSGEPWTWGSIWTVEEGVELLLDAELEPDADRDGYGDLTQDLCPKLDNRSYEYCRAPRDREAPRIWARSGARQAFLRSGHVRVQLGSNETGIATVAGRIEVNGRGGRVYALQPKREPIEAGGRTTVRPRVPKGALRVARSAARQGQRILVTLLVGVADATENEGLKILRVRPG